MAGQNSLRVSSPALVALELGSMDVIVVVDPSEGPRVGVALGCNKRWAVSHMPIAEISTNNGMNG
jgi:hypothetical protein